MWLALKKCTEIDNQECVCDGILSKKGFDVVDKKVKISESGVWGRFLGFRRVSWWFYGGGVTLLAYKLRIGDHEI